MALYLERLQSDKTVVQAEINMHHAKDALLNACDFPEPGPFDAETERQILRLALEYHRSINANAHAIADFVRSNR